jgi:putative ABC transport system substrate-binding protein
MRRRDFITALGGMAAAAWPLAARGQQTSSRPTIGFLRANMQSANDRLVAHFVQRLGELGWIEGRTIAIEYRWSEGRRERLPEIVAEFVQLKVAVMVLEGTAAALAAKQATSVIPIVFPVSGDPVGSGLVASLARPGGNVTGLSIQQTDLNGKRLDLMHEVLPGLRRLAIMANVDAPIAVQDMREIQAAARMLGFEVATFEVRRVEDIGPGFERLKGGADALYVCGDPLMDTHRVRINMLALAARLPTMHGIS